MITEALYLLAEHLHTACHSIAFPELSATTVVALRSVVKSTKIVSLQKRCKRLLVQLEAQARFVSSRRDVVDFAPNDGDATAAFLSDEAAAGSSPYAKWFAVERADAQRAERLRQAEASAQGKGLEVDDDDDDRSRRKRKAGKQAGGGRGGRDDDDDDDDEDDNDGGGSGNDDGDDDGDDDDVVVIRDHKSAAQKSSGTPREKARGESAAGKTAKTKQAKPGSREAKRSAGAAPTKSKRKGDGSAKPDELDELRMSDLDSGEDA